MTATSMRSLMAGLLMRPPKMEGIMSIVDLKPKRRSRGRDLVPIGQATGAARFMRKTVADIEADLGGKRELSRIESELIRAFAGGATMI